MKYCYKCGNKLDDNMQFCPKCGTKSMDNENSTPENKRLAQGQYDTEFIDIPTRQEGEDSRKKRNSKTSSNLRMDMQIGMTICLIFGIIYMIMGLVMRDYAISAAMAAFFLILSIMFAVLARSPKESIYILGKQRGVKKIIFVPCCIVIAFIATTVILATANPQDNTQQAYSSTPEKSENATEDTVTMLSDVQQWYEDQMPSVSQNLIEYAQSVKGLSNLNVNESHFYFGGEWNDCYYKFIFVCKVNGENHLGEARAFLKYQDDQIHWFSFEVFDNDGVQSLIETYDDSYDKIIEDYYKELESQYK